MIDGTAITDLSCPWARKYANMGTMNVILGHLAQFASFAAQSEVLCTQGLVHLLDQPHARACFIQEIRSSTAVEVPDNLIWRAEVFQQDRGRPDLEGSTAGGLPIVKVEAKLGAAFSTGQFRSYAEDLTARGAGVGVLLVLVPSARIAEAVREISLAFEVQGDAPWHPVRYPGIAITVIAWEHILDALGNAGLPAPSACDVAQLNAMYRVLSGQHIEPLASIEDLLAWRERAGVFMQLVDRVTRSLSQEGEKRYPIGTERVEGGPEGLEPMGYYRRYLCRPLGDQRPCFSIGVRDPFENFSTPIWMRFHRQTPQFMVIRERLTRSPLGEQLVYSSGHVWIPLDVPLNTGGDQLVAAVAANAEEFATIAYAPLD